MSEEIRNGFIYKADIELSDHGAVMARLEIEYGHGGFQAFGTYEIYSEITREDFTGRFLKRCMEVANAASWSSLRGKPIRVRRRDDGSIAAIGHFLNDDWYSPREEFLAKEGE